MWRPRMTQTYPQSRSRTQPVAKYTGHVTYIYAYDIAYEMQRGSLPTLLGQPGPIRIERQVKLFSVGAISIAVRVPFEVSNITELVPFHDLRFNNGTSVHDEVVAMAEEVRKELQPHLI